MIQWRKGNDALGTANRGVACESGLCTLCRADCQGKCETWLSCLLGRKLLYPRDFGTTTSGSANTTSLGVGYHALRISGRAFGSHGLAPGLTRDPDDCMFPNVDLTTEFGCRSKTRCRLPVMTGALGSTKVAGDHWEALAVGAAICGFPIVIGENVAGVDPEATFEDGRISGSPALDERIETYLRYHDGAGALIVQLNVEDLRRSVPDYLAERYGDGIVVELKWGQGAKAIGGEIQVHSLERAEFLKRRGYVVDPDPSDPGVRRAFESGALDAFARHSRVGATDLDSPAQVRDVFMATVEELRARGFERITLKTGAFGMEALALAIRLTADARLDLLTIDGAGGGTGMSPWNMMEQWGVPSLPLHAKAYEYCTMLDEQGVPVPDLAFGGGFAREDHVFKALALGAPYTRLVCMGRAPMIASFIGANIEGALEPTQRERVHGHWQELPASVKAVGTVPEEIFAGWEPIRERLGSDGIRDIPWGAIAMYGYMDKLACGLQQLMAGARKFSLDEIDRGDLMSANRETETETGIPYLTEAGDEQAAAIMHGHF